MSQKLNDNEKRYVKIIVVDAIILLLFIPILYLILSLADRLLPHYEGTGVMSTSEIEAFNNEFEVYKGGQTGESISRYLLGRLIANSSTYADEPERVLSVIYENGTAIEYDGKNLEEYQNDLKKLRNLLNVDSRYIVSFEYNSATGYIEKILIEDKKGL